MVAVNPSWFGPSSDELQMWHPETPKCHSVHRRVELLFTQAEVSNTDAVNGAIARNRAVDLGRGSSEGREPNTKNPAVVEGFSPCPLDRG